MSWIKQTWNNGYKWLMALLVAVAIFAAFQGEVKIAFWVMVAGGIYWIIAYLMRNNP